MQRQGRNSQNKQYCSLGAGSSFPLKEYTSCFTDTETSIRWEKLTVSCPPANRSQTGWTDKIDDADSHLPQHHPVRRMSMSWWHPLWIITIKHLTAPSRSGLTGFFCVCLFNIPHHTACGILVLQPGIEPAPPAWVAQSLNHWTTREGLGTQFWGHEPAVALFAWQLWWDGKQR